MAFHNQSFATRLLKMGDEAEQKFEELFPNHHRLGLNKPPFNVQRLPKRASMMPDYLMEDKYVECQGLGRDQIIKLKLDKYDVLSYWAGIHPVELFLWDSKNKRWTFTTLDRIRALVNSPTSPVELARFHDGNAYLAIPAASIEGWTKWQS